MSQEAAASILASLARRDPKETLRTVATKFPTWSPDSRSLTFFTVAERKLKRIDVAGGAPLTLSRG